MNQARASARPQVSPRSRRRRVRALRLAFLLVPPLAWSACAEEESAGPGSPAGASVAATGASSGLPWTPGSNVLDPPTALMHVVEGHRADLAAARHPSDGGGRARLVMNDDGAPPRASARSSARFEIVYEAGELGVAVDGAVFLLVDPFWEWSSPQPDAPEGMGYTLVTTEAEGVELEAVQLDRSLLGVFVRGRALIEGEELRIVYGAGPRGAKVDNFRDQDTHLWIAVDGDGDGVRAVLADSPSVDIDAGPAAQLALHWPSSVRTGESVRVVAAVLDPWGSTGVEVEGTLRLETASEELRAKLVGHESIELALADEGRAAFELEVPSDGIHTLFACFEFAGEDAREPLCATSNPLLAHAAAPRLLWGDLHGHSNLSDGTGTPADYYHYARDVAALDFAALTDHDHWGVRFLDQTPELWEGIQEVVREFHAPGEFVALLGYEWTSWIHGHRHVIYFEDQGTIYSTLDERYETPAQLWDALRGQPALTFAHHSAGGPIANNWSFAPDPVLEPVTEIVSVHGVSEAPANPGRIYSPRDGYFVRDALDAGYRLGFLGSGDSHDGHPGLAHYGSPSGGVAAVFAEENTRESILAALRARRVYATSGPRIFLNANLAGAPMGSDVSANELGETVELEVRGIGTGPIDELHVVRSGELAQLLDCGGVDAFRHVFVLEDLQPGEYVYLNLRQSDRGQAWSSPWFVR